MKHFLKLNILLQINKIAIKRNLIMCSAANVDDLKQYYITESACNRVNAYNNIKD
jgi:hypothetical protein